MRSKRIRHSQSLTRPLQLAGVPAPTDSEAAGRHFLPEGYVVRAEPEYFDDEQRALEYQPDVYRDAARAAESLGATTIVDVGCGHARKLVALHPRFEVIGMDIGSNIDRCRHMYPFGTWIDHDLESDEPLPLANAVLARSVVVCADVVEHLQEPQRALRVLRDAIPPARALLISTPDRSRVEGAALGGPPRNPSHVREWTRGEFAALLRWCGFDRGHLTFTRPHTDTTEVTTILYVQEAQAGGT